MSSSAMIIEFAGMNKFAIDFEAGGPEKKEIPSWVKFANMPCPGNIEHGPEIDHCRLGIEIEKLIKFFSSIASTENGRLTLMYEDGLDINIHSDSQTIFYNSLWYVLLHSDCSVFKNNQWARSNFIPSTDPDRMFYLLFSVFIVTDVVVNPDQPPQIDNFKRQLRLQFAVLNNLLERIRKRTEFSSDSISNGIVVFSSLLSLLEMGFDEFYLSLKERIKKDFYLQEKLNKKDC